jgi:hypothetical protein
MASRIATKLILGVGFMLSSLGVDLDGPKLMLEDNMSEVLITSILSTLLKKKRNAIAYHRVREATTSKIMRFAYIKSEENFNDILTKPLSNEEIRYLVENG